MVAVIAKEIRYIKYSVAEFLNDFIVKSLNSSYKPIL